jgi:hypothetical protein
MSRPRNVSALLIGSGRPSDQADPSDPRAKRTDNSE